MAQKSNSSTTSGSTTDAGTDSMEIEWDHQTKGPGPVQGQPLLPGSNYSDAQLLYFLHDRKADPRSPLLTTSAKRANILINDIQADVDLHPITILTTLGVNLRVTTQLEICYYFFSYTRYPRSKAAFTRDRMTTDGLHCWSQGGGRAPVIDEKKEGSSQGVVVGWKRKFTFVEKAKNEKRSSVMLGAKAYIFRLEEMIAAEDEEEEERMASERQTPDGSLCIYRLHPIMQSTAKKKDIQLWGPAYPLPDDQTFPLVSRGSPQTHQRELHFESPRQLLLDNAQGLHERQAEEVSQQTLEPSMELDKEVLESGVLYNPEEWNSPELIYIPGHAERYDLQWMGPFNKS